MATKKKLRKLYWLFTLLSYLGLFLPLSIWVIANRETYFVQKQGMSVSMGFIIACIYGFILFKKGFKAISPIISCLVLTVVVYALNSIIKDLLPITCFFSIGVTLFTIFSFPSKRYKRLLNSFTEESIRTEAREEQKKIISGRV